MKIIHILCGKANPQKTLNGVNVVVDRYATLMFEQGYDVEVWGIADNPHTNLPSPEYPIRFFQQYHSWPCKLDPKLIESLGKIDTASTAIHFHGGFLRELPKIVRMLSNRNYLIMPHGVYAKYCLKKRWWLKLPYFGAIERRFIRKSKGLLLLHENELDTKIARFLQGVPKYIIPNGADTRLDIRNVTTDALPQTGPIVWGYCGRIDNAHKAVDKMVRSFLRFAKQRTGERHILSIIGDGPELDTVRSSHARAIDSGKIQIHGELFEHEKFTKLRNMHYFLHLSNWDGIPLACLDAMALGIPLLVTPGTNLDDDVVSYKAGLATSLDEDAVVESMHKLINMNRGELVEGCLRLVSDKYNWQRSCRLLIEVYQHDVTEATKSGTSRPTRLETFIRELAAEATRQNLKFLVLKNQEGLPEELGSRDIDVLVDKDKLRKWKSILKTVSENLGLVHRQGDKLLYCRMQFIDGFADRDTELEIDLIPVLNWRGTNFMSAEDILRRAVVYRDNIWMTTPADDCVISFCLSYLHGGTIKEKYLESMSLQASENRDEVFRLMSYVFSRKIAEKVVASLIHKDVSHIARKATTYRIIALLNGFRRHPLRFIYTFCLGYLIELKIKVSCNRWIGSNR